MVAETVRRSANAFRGVRPLNPTRDMSGVAKLLEQAFREDLTYLQLWSRVPLLRNLSSYMWAASFSPGMPDSLLGFVWEEDRRILGNVTVTPDEGRRSRWLVSNVAVDERYRRRGIGHELMEAAVTEAKRRGVEWLILNVRPRNDGAIRLYEKLGFAQIDTEMSYVRGRQGPPDSPPVEMRLLQPAEYRFAFEMAKASLGERMRSFRPPRQVDYALHFEDRFAEGLMDFFIGQSSERWGYFEGTDLLGMAFLHAQRIGSPHSIEIRVALPARGRLENGLVAFALTRLKRFARRDTSIRILSSHHELVDAVIDNGFVPTQGLTLMAKEL